MDLPRIDDRWLWISFGIAGFVAVRAIAYGLNEVRRLNEVPEEPSPPSGLSAETEDGTVSLSTKLHEIPIKLHSLRSLATSPNFDIRKAATKILITRFLSDPSAKVVLHADLESTDPEVRETARRAVSLIERHHGWSHEFTQHNYPSGRSEGRPHPRRSRPLSEESPEEQEVRRRRREAMVLNEGDRPVSQDDIIEGPRRRLSQLHGHSGSTAEATRSPTTEADQLPPHRARSASDPNIHPLSALLNTQNEPLDDSLRVNSNNALTLLRELRDARRALQQTEEQQAGIDESTLRDLTSQIASMDHQMDDDALREITSEIASMDNQMERLMAIWRETQDENAS